MIRLDDIDLETHEVYIKDVALIRGDRLITLSDLPDGLGWRIAGLMTSDSAPIESGRPRVQFVLVVFIRSKPSAGYR